MRAILVILAAVLAILACRKATPEELYGITPTPPPSPTATQEVTVTVTRTVVPEHYGVVVAEELTRRVGPGEQYAAYVVSLKRGDRVRVLTCVGDWAQIGDQVWAAWRWEGKVLIEGGCE